MIDLNYKFKRLKQKILIHFCGTVTNVHTDRPAIALTFDDGPDPVDTPRMLDLLDRHGARATFFVLGVRAARHPEIIERMATSGHALANHGWSHTSMPTLPLRQRRLEILKTHNVLKPYGSRLFRPPFGHIDRSTHRAVRQCNHKVIGWNLLAHDWLDRTDKEMLAWLESKLKPGSIVLLHDSLYTFEKIEHRNRGPLLSALDRLLENLKPKFSFVTVPELLEMGRPNKIYSIKPSDPAWLATQKHLNEIDVNTP